MGCNQVLATFAGPDAYTNLYGTPDADSDHLLQGCMRSGVQEVAGCDTHVAISDRVAHALTPACLSCCAGVKFALPRYAPCLWLSSILER